jgi:protein-S-isoprenylcysteine O-methyltransferase
MADLDSRIQQRNQAIGSLETIPTSPAHTPHEDIPNTPLAATCIAFTLGVLFALGLPACLLAGTSHRSWWYTPSLAFFASAWAAFHWLEFAITAGWNREKCSVDCKLSRQTLQEKQNHDSHSAFLLNNGRLYHAANALAVLEYILTLYLKPDWKIPSFLIWTGSSSSVHSNAVILI